jgi:hypothetical protein
MVCKFWDEDKVNKKPGPLNMGRAP